MTIEQIRTTPSTMVEVRQILQHINRLLQDLDGATERSQSALDGEKGISGGSLGIEGLYEYSLLTEDGDAIALEAMNWLTGIETDLATEAARTLISDTIGEFGEAGQTIGIVGDSMLQETGDFLNLESGGKMKMALVNAFDSLEARVTALEP